MWSQAPYFNVRNGTYHYNHSVAMPRTEGDISRRQDDGDDDNGQSRWIIPRHHRAEAARVRPWVLVVLKSFLAALSHTALEMM